MNDDLKKVYTLTNKLFPNIDKFCKNCRTCCRTYGWLLKQEARILYKKGYSVVGINKNLYCLDSFSRNENNKRILDQIPKCLFHKGNGCLIHKEKPLDCRLYPIKIKFREDKAIVGLSLGCKYVSSLTEKKKEQLCKKISSFLTTMPKSIVNNYLDLMKNIYLISKPKRFWMKEIAKMEKKNNFWKIIG